MTPMIEKKRIRLKRFLRLANEYATTVQKRILPAVTRMDTKSEFKK